MASKRAEMNREMEISAQRREVLAQQERLKMLEDQRDLEVMEAEYNVYAAEELKLNAEIRNGEVKSTLSFSQLPKPHTVVVFHVLKYLRVYHHLMLKVKLFISHNVFVVILKLS